MILLLLLLLLLATFAAASPAAANSHSATAKEMLEQHAKEVTRSPTPVAHTCKSAGPSKHT